jgi:pimeloyl-ACP methyl ester carboxylesterase
VRRGWKIALAVVIALAVLLAVNTIVTDQQTKPAGVTVDGGRILHLTGGDVQVVDTGPRHKRQAGAPIVLLHCYGCSLHWWDRVLPFLEQDHRVIRIDLLGFGGSEKPKADYSMEEEGQLVALALGRLHVQGAVVVGHSMGFDVATALAKQSSELVDRLVDIDEGPDSSYNAGFPFVAQLGYVPVIGEALNRIVPDSVVRDSYGVAFAPDYDLGDFGDQVVDDFHAMTYTSYDRAASEEGDYTDAEPLNDRVRDAAVPLLVIFGTEDQLWDDPAAAAQAYRTVPGAEIEMVHGAGHSPNVEKPHETARLILDFASAAQTASGRRKR